MSELQKFDPAQLMNGVRDRIKATFVSLIPDEQWESMIKKEVDAFFDEDRKYRSNYETHSQFKDICYSVFKDITREKLHDYMSTFTSDVWDNGMPVLNEQLKKALIESAPEILTSMFKSMFQQAVNNTRNY